VRIQFVARAPRLLDASRVLLDGLVARRVILLLDHIACEGR